MNRRFFLLALAIVCALPCAARPRPEPRVVDLTAPDGAKLKATYYAAGKPGPGVMLFHQCDHDRKMWNDLAPRLAASGFNVLALDFRGFGESSGTSALTLPPQEGRRQVTEVWPGDVDTAFAYLAAQPGVKKDVIGAAGASCGVNQSIQLARRHPEVKSLVLLSGSTDREGRHFLRRSPQLPIFASAADDDEGVVEVLRWIVGSSRNPGNRFQHYQSGGHGIEMFAPHPELTAMIINWFDTTLRKTPGRAPASQGNISRGSNILDTIDEPGGAAKAAEMLAEARQRDPQTNLFSEAVVNMVGYQHLRTGDTAGAIEIFKLNATAFPTSPNACDSLADAYLAAGQRELAIENAEKALRLLESDTTDSEGRRKQIRESVEQKLKQLKSPGE